MGPAVRGKAGNKFLGPMPFGLAILITRLIGELL